MAVTPEFRMDANAQAIKKRALAAAKQDCEDAQQELYERVRACAFKRRSLSV
jgi:hypothetical protein